ASTGSASSNGGGLMMRRPMARPAADAAERWFGGRSIEYAIAECAMASQTPGRARPFPKCLKTQTPPSPTGPDRWPVAGQGRPVTGQSAVAEADVRGEHGRDARASHGVIGPGDEDDLDAAHLGRRRGRRAGGVEVGQRERAHAVDDRLRAAARLASEDRAVQSPRHALAAGRDDAVAVEVLLE